jgi:hypothetical protein
MKDEANPEYRWNPAGVNIPCKSEDFGKGIFDKVDF